MAETRFERVFAADPNRVKLPPRTQVPQQQFLPQKSQSAAAFSQLGSDVFTAGGQLAQMGAVNQARDESRQAKAAALGARQKIRELLKGEGGLLTLQGQEALAAQPAVDEKLREIIEGARGQAGGNSGVKQALDGLLIDEQNRAEGIAGNHYLKARNDAEEATTIAQLLAATQDLSDDPTNEGLINEVAQLKQEALSRILTDDKLILAEQRRFFSATYRDIITNKINEGDIAGAQSLLDNTITIDGEEMSIEKLLTDKDEADVKAKLLLRTIDLRADENMLMLTAGLPDGTESEYLAEANKLPSEDRKPLREKIKTHFVQKRIQQTEFDNSIKEKLNTSLENDTPTRLNSDEEKRAAELDILRKYRKAKRLKASFAEMPYDRAVMAEVFTAQENGTFAELDMNSDKMLKGLGKEYKRVFKEWLAAKALLKKEGKAQAKEIKDRKKDIIAMQQTTDFSSQMEHQLKALKFSDSQLADVKIFASRIMQDRATREPNRVGFTNSEFKAILDLAAKQVREKDSGFLGMFANKEAFATAKEQGLTIDPKEVAKVADLHVKLFPNKRPKQVRSVVALLVNKGIFPSEENVNSAMNLQDRAMKQHLANEAAAAEDLITARLSNVELPPTGPDVAPTTAAPTTAAPTTAAPVPVATSTQPVVTAAGTPTSQAMSLDIAKQARKNVVDRISTSRSPLSAPLTRERVEALIKAETKSLKQRVKDQQELDKLMEISAATPAQKAASLERFKRERIATIKGQERIKELERQHRAGEVTPLGGRRGGTPLSPDVERLLQEFSNDKLPEGGRSFFPDPSGAPEFPQAPDVTDTTDARDTLRKDWGVTGRRVQTQEPLVDSSAGSNLAFKTTKIQALMERSSTNPVIIPALQKAGAKLGIKLVITDGPRTVAQQKAIMREMWETNREQYNKNYGEEPPETNTFQSKHLSNDAADLRIPPQFKKTKALREQFGKQVEDALGQGAQVHVEGNHLHVNFSRAGDTTDAGTVARIHGAAYQTSNDPVKRQKFMADVARLRDTADTTIVSTINDTVRRIFGGANGKADGGTTLEKVQETMVQIAVHESAGSVAFEHRRQLITKNGKLVPQGVGRGIFQVEPTTAYNLISNSQKAKTKGLLGAKAKKELAAQGLDFSKLVAKNATERKKLLRLLETNDIVATIFATAKLLEGAKATGKIKDLQ
jgi:hypothetical protein